MHPGYESRGLSTPEVAEFRIDRMQICLHVWVRQCRTRPLIVNDERRSFAFHSHVWTCNHFVVQVDPSEKFSVCFSLIELLLLFVLRLVAEASLGGKVFHC